MGNILTQKRNGGGTSATALDELTYNYHTTTDGLVSNRLYHVNDVVSAGNYSDDIDDQGTFNNTHSTIETANNYGYDELGNLVRDAQEEIASIEWTVYGKMKKITRNSGSSKADLEFGYDASGNRLWKKVTPKGSGAVISTYYYLRDAQGNEMCRYVKYTNTSSQLMYVAQEHSIYGSSRVGVDNRKDTLYMSAAYTPTWGGVGTSRRDLGSKSFELANHLGNVLVTVSDKPVYKVSSTTIFFNPEITSISDYYPFGAPIQGRSAAFGGEYRFGFNNHEKDDEVSWEGNHNTATFWEYDGRLGRRWNTDPRPNPSISNYATFANNPIWYSDILGDTIRWNDLRGRTLMLLDNHKKDMITQNTKGIYDQKIQWFEPNAKNYMKVLYTNPKIGTMDGIKHFSWVDITNYADNHQSLWGYAWNGAPNDWKAHKEGANGLYLVTVGGKAYWSDAIGQIPFAINQMRSNLQSGQDMNGAIKSTIERGKQFGGGLFGPADYSNSYDNFMVMRGALFASQRFTVLKVPNVKELHAPIKLHPYDIQIIIRNSDSNLLGKPIDKKTATQNGF